ncbi:MAG: hypothetical protein ACPG5P_00650 [Saprospiraceae bacterium]
MPSINKNNMSLEVPIILLIIATPVYFLFRFLMAKLKIGNKQSRKSLALIPAFLASPIIYIGSFMILIYSLSYYPKDNFNADEWSSNTEERYKMSEDIIDSKMLIDLSMEEVTTLLGNDFSNNDGNHITYYIGFVPGLFNIDPAVLDIIFKDGKVINVYQHET